jgi:hypothetical protein
MFSIVFANRAANIALFSLSTRGQIFFPAYYNLFLAFGVKSR